MNSAKKLLLTTLLTLFIALVACREPISPTPTTLPTTPTNTTMTPSPDVEPTKNLATSTPVSATPSAQLPIEYDWAPQLIYTSPQADEPALLDGAITLRFDQPMDQASVKEALQVVDYDGNSADGELTWTRPDTLIFTPKNPLARENRYTVRVSEAAKGQNGKALERAFSFNFETAPNLAVSQITPADGTENVTADGAITVIFNRPVVPLVSTVQQDQLPNPLTITPAIAGKGEWVSTSIYRFVPDPRWAGGTEYSVTVSADLADVTGSKLPEAFVSRFSTEQPKVIGRFPDMGEMTIGLTDTITLTFNMAMDQASTEGAISFDPAAPLTFTWNEAGDQVGITPQQRLPLATELTVAVSTAATSASGQAPLAKRYQAEWQTHPFPAIQNTYPEDKARLDGSEVAYFSGISINFVSPMDWATITEKIIISPMPEKVNYPRYAESGTSYYLSFSADYATEYSVTIPATAADIYGNTLGEPYTFTFTTGLPEPVASFNLPSGLAYLSSSFPSTVDLVYRYVGSADIYLDTVANENIAQQVLAPYDPKLFLAGLNDLQQTVALDKEGSGAIKVELANGGILPTGLYNLGLKSSELGSDLYWWQNQYVRLIVADTNLVIKETPNNVHIWATDLETGQPVAGRNVTLFSADDNYPNPNVTERATAITDGEGLAVIAKTWGAQQWGGYYTLLAISEQAGAVGFGMASTQWNQSVSPWELNPNSAQGEPLYKSYLVTDRPLYRPGDTVYVRGWVRQNRFGRYNLPDLTTLSLNYQQLWNGELQTLNVALDERGGFSAEILLPADAKLGEYGLNLDQSDGTNRFDGVTTVNFTVGEFRKPEFTVTVTPDKAEALRGEAVNVTVQAEYLFGADAGGLPVTWSVYSNDYTYFYDGPFSFSADLYAFFDPFSNTVTSYYASGQGVTAGNGQFTFTIPADALDQLPAGQSKTLTIEVQVQDVNETQIAQRAEVIFHAAESYVGIRAIDYAYPLNEPVRFELISTDWAGNEVANQNVELILSRREWLYENDPRMGQGQWKPTDTEVGRTALTTGANGKVSAEFNVTEGGSYFAKAILTTASGRQHISESYAYVYADDVAWRSSPEVRKMELITDKNLYQVGETARILVQSPYAGPLTAWLTIERGEVMEQRLITLNSTSDIVEIPLSADSAPNVQVTITAIKPVDGSERPYADIRIGSADLQVNPIQFQLNVAIVADKPSYEPDDVVTYQITTTDQNGNPVSADLSLALVDLAILTLKADNSADVFANFYSPQPLRSQMGSGLLISGEGLELKIPQDVGGFGGGGGGDGMLATAQAYDLESEESRSDSANAEGVRSEFRDTAYWNGTVTTDSNGQATLQVELPDNLTTWRMLAKAISAETLVGQTSNDIVVRKPLLVRPITPRFFTVGDQVQIGAVINNNTDQPLSVLASLEATGVTLTESAEQTVEVPAQGSVVVRWPVRAEDVKGVDLTFRVSSGEYSDGSKPTVGNNADRLIPVYRYTGEDIVATAGVLDQADRRVEAVLLPPALDPDQGEVKLTFNASLAQAILSNLDDNVDDEQYIVTNCPYSYAYRLLNNTVILKGIRDLGLQEEKAEIVGRLEAVIASDSAELQALQIRGSGWKFCNDSDSDPSADLTADALIALSQAQAVGFEVTVGAGAEKLLRGELGGEINNTYRANRQAYFLYALSLNGQDVAGELETLLEDGRSWLDSSATAMLILALAAQGGDEAIIAQLLSDLNTAVTLSATGAHWQEEGGWGLYSDVYSTAWVVRALAAVNPDNPQAVNAIRWLMNARKGTHSWWGSFYETSWTMAATTEWMAATDELEADYDYQLYVDGAMKQDERFDATTLAETQTVAIPLAELSADTAHFFDIRKTGQGRLYYTAYLDAFLSAEQYGAVDRGFAITRTYYEASCDASKETCEPLTSLSAGQDVRVELTIITTKNRNNVLIEDPLPAGADAVDPNLDTSAHNLGAGMDGGGNDGPMPYLRGYWGWWFFNKIEFRDEKVVFVTDYLPAGTYQYTYYLHTIVPGTYQVRPTVAQQVDQAEVFGRSNGQLFIITE